MSKTKNKKIYIAGHNGLVGSALVRNLEKKGYTNLITRTHSELDLTNQQTVADFFESEKPDEVYLAAAKVGGIMANKTQKADFIYNNLQIQNNIIHGSWKNNVKKLLFLGSSCIYPRECLQPIKEKYLMTGSLEETNDAYALAKIAGIKMCQSFNEQYSTNFISVMPTNLYGINDNFNLETSHVLPALIRRFHEAKLAKKTNITLWGSGSPMREFLHVDDLADATIFLMQNYNKSDIINIGTGEEISIKNLAETIKKIIGFNGKISWDTSKPDGTPRKLLDVSRLNNLGWKYNINLKYGIKNTYKWYLNNISK